MDYIAFYVNLVKNGLAIEKVPSKYREAVKKALNMV